MFQWQEHCNGNMLPSEFQGIYHLFIHINLKSLCTINYIIVHFLSENAIRISASLLIIRYVPV